MDLTILSFLAAPFVASLVIAGIHAYLGVHVVERGRHLRRPLAGADRGVRRDDRDSAARGSAAIRTRPAVYWVSLLFTFIGAAIFSTIRSRHARIPQEAIIGISYAVASAATILALSKSTSEGEHLKDMLVGNILAVSWDEVWQTAVLYVIIGAVPLHLPQAVPRDFDESRRRGGVRHRRCGCGTSCSTPRSASS